MKKQSQTDWEAAWSVERGRYYFQDRNTGKSQWERPPEFTGELPAKPAPEPKHKVLDDEDKNLPVGWKGVRDQMTGGKYWYNTHTGERTWFQPQSPNQEDDNRSRSDKQNNRKKEKTDVINTLRWSAEHYASRLEEAQRFNDQSMLRAVLKEMTRSNGELSKHLPHPGVQMMGSPPATIEWSAKDCQDAVLLGLVEDLGTRPKPRLSVSSKSVCTALHALAERDPRVRVCGVNCAHGREAGGGYFAGNLGDEEDLCRRIPLLHASLLKAHDAGMYPFGPSTVMGKNLNKHSTVLLTPGLVIARGTQEMGFPILSGDNHQVVHIVSAAAPDRQNGEKVDRKEVMTTLRTLLIAPPVQDPYTTVLVIGLWGIGPQYDMKPSDLADMLYTVILEQGLGRLYDEIHFAFPQNPSLSHDPGTAFRSTLEKKYNLRLEEYHF